MDMVRLQTGPPTYKSKQSALVELLKFISRGVVRMWIDIVTFYTITEVLKATDIQSQNKWILLAKKYSTSEGYGKAARWLFLTAKRGLVNYHDLLLTGCGIPLSQVDSFLSLIDPNIRRKEKAIHRNRWSILWRHHNKVIIQSKTEQ